MRYLVTGGSGFIGEHLILDVLSKDPTADVIVIDKVPPRLQDTRIRFFPSDIRCPIAVDEKLNDCVLIHLAAVCKEPGFSWEEYSATNYKGTKHVVDFAESQNIHRIIFTSTMMVFRAGEQRYSEDDLKAPDTAYGISKLLAEEILIGWAAKSTERRLTILRPGVVLGKGENANYTRLFKALRRNAFCYVGRRNTIKGSVYVKDVVSFINYSIGIDLPHQVYNFVFPQPTSIEEIVETICKKFGWKRIVPVVPYFLLMAASYGFEVLNAIGLKNSIHRRRIQKLYCSTNLCADLVVKDGFNFSYNLEQAIWDWKEECGGDELT